MKTMRRKKIFLVVVCFLILFFASLLFTPAGVWLVCFCIEMASGGELQVGGVSGRLVRQFSVTDVYIGDKTERGSLKRLELLWEPFALLEGRLHLKKVIADGFYIRVVPDTEEKSRQDLGGIKEDASQTQTSAASLTSGVLPLQIVLDQCRITDFFYDRGKDEDGDANTSFFFKEINIAATVSKQNVVLRKFQLDGPDMAANLYGSVDLQEESLPATLEGSFRFAGFGFHSMTGTLSVAGPLQEMSVLAKLNHPGELVVKGTLSSLLTKDTFWQAELFARDFDLSQWILYCPQIVVEKCTAEMNGDFSHYKGHALFHGKWGILDTLSLEGDLWGNEEFIDFSTLALRRGEAVVEVDGGWISWQKIFDMKGMFTVKNINPAIFAPGFDGNIDGRFYTEAGVVDEDFTGFFKDISFEGILHDRFLAGKGNLFLCNKRFATDDFYLHADGGKLSIQSAYLDWGEGGGWQADIVLQAFDPASVFPQYSGAVDGAITSQGHFASDTEPFSASLQVREFIGELRGQKLRGTGGISITDNLLVSEGLSLQLGQSALHITKGNFAFGEPVPQGGGRAFSLSLNAHSPALEELMPDINGAFTLTADLSGTTLRPVGRFEFSGERLAWQNFSLHQGKLRLVLQGEERKADQEVADGEVKLTGFRYGDIQLQQVLLTLCGERNNHRVTVIGDGSLEGRPFAVHLAATGAIGAFTPFWQWKGEILQGEFDLHQYGQWVQQGKSTLSISRSGGSVENFALQSSFASLFSSLSVNDDRGHWNWKITSKINEMELDHWQKTFDLPVDIEGKFSAELSANGEDLFPATADFSADFPSTVVAMEDIFSHGEAIQFIDGRVTGQLRDGLFTVTGGFRESGSGGLQCAIEIGEQGEPFSGKLPLAGSIGCDGLDVSLLGNFLSYSQPAGRLYADLSLGGFLQRPKLSGKLSLNGGIGILSQGIFLKNPQITLAANPEETRLQGRAFSGDGVAILDGYLRYDGVDIVADCDVRGKNFLAVDLPEYSFVVDPDIHFHGTKRNGQLDGNIKVVSGNIAPGYLPDTISESDDVIIVKKEKLPASRWQFSMNMGIDFGKDVMIDGYGLTGSLSGKLQLVMTPEELFSATGALELGNGKFTMYGRSLDITRGRIIFSGGPIDNPGVDVRAEKSMSSQQTLEDGYTVGVDISGLVQNLQYALFSTPAMSETEILSYMILGHSLAGSDAGEGSILAAAAESFGLTGGSVLLGDLGKLLSFDDIHLEGSVEKEDVSLVVGKRLTSDIYVGYDVNMYSQLGEFWVRYDLGKGFSVQTFSSSQSTGGDLQFSFDR